MAHFSSIHICTCSYEAWFRSTRRSGHTGGRGKGFEIWWMKRKFSYVYMTLMTETTRTCSGKPHFVTGLHSNWNVLLWVQTQHILVTHFT